MITKDTDNRRSVTNGDTVIDTPLAQLHQQSHDNSVGMLQECFWEAPVTNQDVTLFVNYIKVPVSGNNRIWAVSACAAYRDIPEDVTDDGEYVGIHGWPGAVSKEGYRHLGTLGSTVGVSGTGGYQGSGDALAGPNAVTKEVVCVRGNTITQPGHTAKILNAFAGKFVSDILSPAGTVPKNYGIYARASGGDVNWVAYFEAGKMFQAGHTMFGNQFFEMSCAVSMRRAGNSVEFGYPGPGGYGSSVGSTFMSGYPFLAFCAEVDPTGNTFTTRGKKGAVIYSDLTGAMIFSRLTNASAAGQTLTESLRIDDLGRLKINLPVYADNAAALAGGLTATTVYRTAAGEMRVVV